METAKQKFCESCGKPLAQGARFCEGCGHAVASEPAAATLAAKAPASTSSPLAQPPPPAFLPPPPPSAISPAPSKPHRAKTALAVLGTVGVLALGGLGFLFSPAGKQLLPRITGVLHSMGVLAPSTASVSVSQQVLQAAKTIYTTMNVDAVENGSTQPNIIQISEPTLVTHVMTYHWNGARGKTPGTIALNCDDGTKYGPWQAEGSSGQGGVPNASWSVAPCVILQPGKYTLIDSDPASWSQNATSAGQGMCEIKGLPWSQVSSGP